METVEFIGVYAKEFYKKYSKEELLKIISSKCNRLKRQICRVALVMNGFYPDGNEIKKPIWQKCFLGRYFDKSYYHKFIVNVK